MGCSAGKTNGNCRLAFFSKSSDLRVLSYIRGHWAARIRMDAGHHPISLIYALTKTMKGSIGLRQRPGRSYLLLLTTEPSTTSFLST